MELFFPWLVCAFFTAAIAISKSRSGFGWLILGLLFPILALIAVAVMPSLKGKQDEPTPATHVKCPECRELVFMDAAKCKHCGARLVPQTPEPSNAEQVGRALGSRFSRKK